ncbi:hypothetical protein MRX96_055510 [Rhipicephalus microplus]
MHSPTWLRAIVHVQRQPAVPLGCGPIVLVLTVTQEAAQQRPQLKQLEEGAEICVATPGRLVAFMENCKINLNRCT